MHFNTINAMFATQAHKNPHDVIIRYRPQPGADYQDLTWVQVEEMVVRFASALIDRGFRPGDRLAILAFNRLEWLIADLGTLMVGGVDVPIYHTNTPAQCEYILNDAQTRFAVVENETQLAKIQACASNLKHLEYIIIMDGSVPDDDDRVIAWDTLMQIGAKTATDLSAERTKRMEQVRPADLATVVYTSGTTGPPKGCMVSHQNTLCVLASIDKMHNIASRTNLSLLVLPLSHFYPRVSGYYFNLYKNIPLALAESIDTLARDLAAASPTYFCCVPRILEKVHGRITQAAAQGSKIKQLLFNWAIGRGRDHYQRINVVIFEPMINRILFTIADRLVFGKIRARFGGKLSFAVSAGAPLAAEVGEFIQSIGVKVIEFYGLTETLGGTMTTLDACRYGTVGKAMPGFDIKIADDGEILIRGNNFMGYLNHPDQTSAIIRDGWCYTGDVGRWQDGHLVITDRKKNLIITSGGKNIAPQNLENKILSTIDIVSSAMVYGDGRKYLTVLLTLDPELTEQLAMEKGLVFEDYASLTQSPEIRNYVQVQMDAVNDDLPPYETLKKFVILPREFSMEKGEITPTLKLKRNVVRDKYGDQMDALYEADD